MDRWTPSQDGRDARTLGERDDSFTLFGRRGEIEELMRRPDPSSEELAEADLVVQPLMEQLAAAMPQSVVAYSESPGGGMFALEMIPAMMAIVWLEFVWFPSLFTVLIFRGGLLLRLFNIVAVRRDGKRASGLRMCWRALVPAPVGLLLGFLGSLHLAGGAFMPAAITAVAWGLLFLVVILLVISACHPQRSISDRLAGTYLVPR